MALADEHGGTVTPEAAGRQGYYAGRSNPYPAGHVWHIQWRRGYQVAAGREAIAALAQTDGEMRFAREVLAGCWDHRRDVAREIERERGQ
jgi:hypothetical protein